MTVVAAAINGVTRETGLRLVRRLACAIVAGLGVAFVTAPASAQIVALVNGDPITTLDVTHRTKLLTLINQGRAPNRKDVLEELVDERLKLREARKYGAVPTDSEVDTAFASIATRARLNPDQFTQMLAAQGSDARSFKSRIRADMAWTGLVRARYKSVAQVGDRDVADALTARKQTATQKVTEYSLRSIVLVIPRGSPDSAVETRRREAEALRNRFQSCDEGATLARGMREVVVRDVIKRISSDLTPALRELFENTTDGRTTPPERTEAGVELVAVCSRREVAGPSAAQNEIRQELAGERLQSQSKRYMGELRRAALIEYR